MKNLLQKVSLIISLSLLIFFTYGIKAEGSYVGIGIGLHFDLGTLANTISKDGLQTYVGKPSMVGAERVTGCNEDKDCMREVPADFQNIVIAENRLLVMEKSTGMGINVETSGPMIGAVLNLFWEKEWENSFLRVGVDYTRRVKGGHSEASIATIRWYDMKFDYISLFIPVYFGLKAKVNNGAAIYGGAGINYYRGGWKLMGSNIGDIPTTLLGVPIGTSTVYDAENQQRGGPVIGEGIKFHVRGIGFNVLIGLEIKSGEKDKWFFEIDRKFAGGQSLDRARSVGVSTSMAPFLAYPQNLSGTIYRFGFKKGI